jgi:hypothetical protein
LRFRRYLTVCVSATTSPAIRPPPRASRSIFNFDSQILTTRFSFIQKWKIANVGAVTCRLCCRLAAAVTREPLHSSINLEAKRTGHFSSFQFIENC